MRLPNPHRGGRPSLRMILIYVALGSAFLPGAIFSAIYSLTNGRTAQGPILRAFVATQEVARAVELDRGGNLVARKGYASPAWLDLVIEDRGGRVAFSTVPDFPPGSSPGFLQIARLADRLVPQVTFIMDRVEFGKVEAGTWFAILPSDAARDLAGQGAPLLRLTALTGFALFAFFFGFIVAATLAAQVGRLERAAMAIAAGDLDTPIKAKGAREIVALAEAMEGLRAAIKENQARRARFLASVSHDLRTPLTSIGGYLEAVEDGLAEDPETLRRYVAIMKERTQVLEERIEGLIDFARMESGEWKLRFENLALGPLFEELAAAAREEAALAGSSLSADLGALGGLLAPVDRALLGRAFENLVGNALSHGRPGGRVALGARRPAGRAAPFLAAIDIDDDGPGIAPADRERAFEAFWRGAGGRAEGPSGRSGSGLGLYIARSIVEGHGWRLEIGSSPLGGARLSILVLAPPGAEGKTA